MVFVTTASDQVVSKTFEFDSAAYIDGQWIAADNGAAIEVFDPATGDILGRVPRLNDAVIEQCIAVAAQARADWRRRLPQERGRVLRRWADLVRAHAADLARTMVREQGKPFHEALSEIEYGASFLEWFGAEASRVYGETIPSHIPGAHLSVTREPIGVVFAVTPWNFPSAMMARKAGAAIAAGCPTIVMPSMHTPFSALALARLAAQAGVPGGVLQVVTGDPEKIATRIASHSKVAGVSFTGSTGVGRTLNKIAASTIKRISLELGGHAPFIVLDDADAALAVDGAMAAKYATSGQDCLAVNRFFVARSKYAEFVRRFAKKSSELRVGRGSDPDVDIGPLIDHRAVDKCLAQIADAVKRGARILTGGGRHSAGRNFLEPTVLADVTDDMLISREETFGPVAAISVMDSETEVVSRANTSAYGLAAYVFGRDISNVMRVAGALDYGMVAINTARFTGPPIPFGGFRQSGLGREGGRHGIEAFTEFKYLCLGTIETPAA